MSQSAKKSASDTINRGIFGSLVILFHLIGAVQFWYSVYYDYNFVHIPEELREESRRMSNPFGGKFKYLTFIDAILQAAYYTIALINDFTGSNEVAPKPMPLIRKIKDYVLAAFAWPIACNVAITFWSIYAVDRELIFPRVLDSFFPDWLNHMCVSFRQYPTRRNGYLGLSLFMACYLAWIHIIYYYSGVWVYPVLEVLALPLRVCFFAGVFVFSLFLYRTGELFNDLIWVKELKSLKAKKGH
uniref:CSON004922 protein n=1 Tax=Culicoides sonorensis TaxID=179676 RepID=A0A336LG15_CULSO